MLGLSASLNKGKAPQKFQKRVMRLYSSGEWLRSGGNIGVGNIATHLLGDNETWKLSISYWLKKMDINHYPPGTTVEYVQYPFSCYRVEDDSRTWAARNERPTAAGSSNGSAGANIYTAGSTSSYHTLNSNDDVIDDELWHHIVLIIDSSNTSAEFTSYVDGEAAGTENITDGDSWAEQTHASMSQLIIGGIDTDSSSGNAVNHQSLAGGLYLDQIFIIGGYTMDADDVASFYNNGKPKNMSNFQSASSKRVYIRADNYKCAPPPASGQEASYAIGSFNRRLGPELSDTSKNWAGSIPWAVVSGVTRTVNVTTPSVLEGLPDYGPNGESVTGCVHFIRTNTDYTQMINGTSTTTNGALLEAATVGSTYFIGVWAKCGSGDSLSIGLTSGHGQVTEGRSLTEDWRFYSWFCPNLNNSDSSRLGFYVYNSNVGEECWITGLTIKEFAPGGNLGMVWNGLRTDELTLGTLGTANTVMPKMTIKAGT